LWSELGDIGGLRKKTIFGVIAPSPLTQKQKLITQFLVFHFQKKYAGKKAG